ncbi:alpha-D-ribose 1-methylphosphonate 5-triphosphate diphosphatase [Halovulum sp. GXIMD14793]
MFDTPSDRMEIGNATMVLPDRVVEGGLIIADGHIQEVVEGHRDGLDFGGDMLIPGIIDLHTDHVEKHVFPRSHVLWDYQAALMAHDGQMIAGGTTTVFDSLCVGATMRKTKRREILEPLVTALKTLAESGQLRADHLLHLRCEISDPETMPLLDAIIQDAAPQLISVMDHTPGDRQSLDVERWFRAMIVDMGVDEPTGREMLAELLDRSAKVGPEVRAHIVAAAKAHDVPLMSHDDRTLAHVDLAVSEGAAISEFPTTPEAARHARAAGQIILGGAPNYLRGGSQSGNVALRDLLAEGLVDVLASDYVPRAPLDAAFAIAEDDSLPIDLPAAIAMVTSNAAQAARLTDRGALTQGLRADLVRVGGTGRARHVKSVWREGQRVY